MKSLICTFLLVLCCISCRTEPPHSVAGNKFISTFSKVAHDEYHLTLYGEGGGFMKTINTFFFHFISDQMMDRDQVRRFYLNTLDRLLLMINTDENLRPYLHHYPFTHRDVQLKISFYIDGLLGYEPSPPNIAYVSIYDDIIFYSVQSANPNKFDQLPGESIQKARGLVEHQNNLMQIPADCGWYK